MTYLDHYEGAIMPVPATDGGVAFRTQAVCTHSWTAFTAKRLAWLYGDGRASSQAAVDDLVAWDRLGRREAA